jgi:hypothetical protein
MRTRRVGAAFALAAAGGAIAAPEDFPMEFWEPEGSRRRLGSLTAAIFLHGGALAILVFLASLAPMIDEEIIPVELIRDQPDATEPEAEPAPAPRALAERRSFNYAPAVQAVEPQIVNPRVIADASPAIDAKVLDMDAVGSVAAPTEIARVSPIAVDRVSAVRSFATARATAVDVGSVGGPVVRGPIRANSPVGPSVGPRKVAAATGTTTGTGKLTIGGGSSVREGILSTRDVVGSPTGPRLVSVDTAVGDGYTRGPGGSGTGTGTGKATESEFACFELPEVKSYLDDVRVRTYDRWSLPPGLDPDQRVTLSFHIDIAGSTSKISLIDAENNALGVSAIDALRSASPFPPIPDAARCLARLRIIATFTNPGAG